MPKKLQDQRRRLAGRQKWRCFFCNCRMELPNTKIKGTKKPHPRCLTYEHWDSRLDAERGTHAGEFRNVASCWECNNKRNTERERLVPLDELRARAGNSGRSSGVEHQPSKLSVAGSIPAVRSNSPDNNENM